MSQYQENNSQENNTGHMYSYMGDKTNNDNNNKEEGDAIRRSIASGNPNYNYQQANEKPDLNYQYSGVINNPNNYGGAYRTSVEQEKNDTYNPFLNWVPYIVFGAVEVLVITLIGCLYQWDMRNHPDYSLTNLIKIENRTEFDKIIVTATEDELNYYDGIFRDINIFVFVGFGMFHSLLKRYAWTATTINMVAIALSFQIGLFTNLLWANAFRESWKSGILNYENFIKAIFNSCTILVSLGCVLGKLSPVQYFIMIVFETVISSLNFQLCDIKLEAIDVGGALYIHTFGAIYGIAIYMVLFCSTKMKTNINKYKYFNISNYFSNITSFIGVMFLFFYFPSFNSSLVTTNNARYRAAISTYLSLTGSLVASFILSAFLNKGRFVIEQILFGCFSGGVIISGCCSINVDYWAALLIGCLCGVITVTMLNFVKSYFIEWGFNDIYNTIIVHGIPGLLGAFITSMMIGNIDNRTGDTDYHYVLVNDVNRENNIQAGVQIGAIFINLGISFISGIATGYLMKVSSCGRIEYYFTDSEFFENEKNIIDNLEQYQFYYGEINRASLFQNKLDFALPRISDDRASGPNYN